MSSPRDDSVFVRHIEESDIAGMRDKLVHDYMGVDLATEGSSCPIRRSWSWLFGRSILPDPVAQRISSLLSILSYRNSTWLTMSTDDRTSQTSTIVRTISPMGA